MEHQGQLLEDGLLVVAVETKLNQIT